VVALLGHFILLKYKNENNKEYKIIKICDFIMQCFRAWHFPILFLQVIFSIINMFLFNGISVLLTSIIITIIAIVIEQFIVYLRYNNQICPINYEVNNTAVFAYIDLYKEIEKINLSLINNLSTSQSRLFSQFELNNNQLNSVIDKIDNYVQLQYSECKILLENKNDFDNSFIELNGRVGFFSNAFEEYKNILENSSKALIYYKEGSSLISDINESFQLGYKQSSNAFMRRLDEIEQQLKKNVDEYSKLNNFILPHIQNISVYNARMDTVLHSLKDGIDNKQLLLKDTSKEISSTFEKINSNINETLEHLYLYIEKNASVLSKILDTYKTNSITPHKLKKILKNWPEISK
jgi:hypothetical protein